MILAPKKYLPKLFLYLIIFNLAAGLWDQKLTTTYASNETQGTSSARSTADTNGKNLKKSFILFSAALIGLNFLDFVQCHHQDTSTQKFENIFLAHKQDGLADAHKQRRLGFINIDDEGGFLKGNCNFSSNGIPESAPWDILVAIDKNPLCPQPDDMATMTETIKQLILRNVREVATYGFADKVVFTEDQNIAPTEVNKLKFFIGSSSNFPDCPHSHQSFYAGRNNIQLGWVVDPIGASLHNSEAAGKHETGHALSLLHEHQRQDRGWDLKVPAGATQIGGVAPENYQVISGPNAKTIGPYDGESNMHYAIDSSLTTANRSFNPSGYLTINDKVALMLAAPPCGMSKKEAYAIYQSFSQEIKSKEDLQELRKVIWTAWKDKYALNGTYEPRNFLDDKISNYFERSQLIRVVTYVGSGIVGLIGLKIVYDKIRKKFPRNSLDSAPPNNQLPSVELVATAPLAAPIDEEFEDIELGLVGGRLQ
jgi:hypothetical protein